MKKKWSDRLASMYWSSKLRHCGSDLHLKRGCEFYGLHHISVGSGVRIGRRCDFYAHPRGMVEHPLVLKIGDNVHMGHRCNLAAIGDVTIEDKVVMGNDVYIADHGHEYRDVLTPIIDQPVTTAKAVRICRGAWLGAKVVVMPGVTVGEQSVVGASSVVTKNVAPKTVVAGNPAVVIKKWDESTNDWTRV